jgi:hypothetical protein
MRDQSDSVFKFASKVRLNTLFDGALAPYGIKPAEAVGVNGGGEVMANAKGLAYRNVGLLVFPDQDGYADHLVPIAGANGQKLPKPRVVEKHLSQMLKHIERVYDTVILSSDDPKFHEQPGQRETDVQRAVKHDLENGFWLEAASILKAGPYRGSFDDIDISDAKARFRHLKLKIGHLLVATDPTLLDVSRKEEFLAQIHETWMEFALHCLLNFDQRNSPQLRREPDASTKRRTRIKDALNTIH